MVQCFSVFWRATEFRIYTVALGAGGHLLGLRRSVKECDICEGFFFGCLCASFFEMSLGVSLGVSLWSSWLMFLRVSCKVWRGMSVLMSSAVSLMFVRLLEGDVYGGDFGDAFGRCIGGCVQGDVFGALNTFAVSWAMSPSRCLAGISRRVSRKTQRTGYEVLEPLY